MLLTLFWAQVDVSLIYRIMSLEQALQQASFLFFFFFNVLLGFWRILNSHLLWKHLNQGHIEWIYCYHGKEGPPAGRVCLT